MGERRGWQLLGIIAALTFLVRLAASARNSYWLDELYSVERYVLMHQNVSEAIESLSQTSIHPPLYQFILFYWIAWFGDTEAATRTLSNLYVTGAVVAMYWTLHRLVDRATAVLASTALALSYAAMLYGLETRSYAQTLALAALSSAAVLLWYRSGLTRDNPTRVSLPAFALIATNTALLLTHYYNFFFWAAQGFLLLLAVAFTPSVNGRVRACAAVVTSFLVQFLVFLAVWGRQTLDSYARVDPSGGQWTVDVTPDTTPRLMLHALTDENLRTGGRPLWLVAAALIALAWRAVSDLRRSPSEHEQTGALARLYLVGVTVLAPFAGYAFFTIVQAERFNARYFLYLVPIIVAVVVVGLMDALEMFMRRVQDNLPGQSNKRATLARLRLGIAIVVILAMVLPGTLEALARGKTDWRGTAANMAAIVLSDPDSAYFLYETAFRSTPMMDYYLRRHDADLRIDGTIRRWEERREDRRFAFEREPEDFAEYDYVIVTFAHHSTQDFPRALEALDETFHRYLTQVRSDGRGLIVYSVPDDF